MKSLYDFIVTPYKKRYDNIRQVDDSELVINTSIEDHKFVSKKAVVVACPSAVETPIKPGDIVYIHHNIFRRYYDVKGRERNSSIYFKDELYFCNLTQIYMYNLNCNLDYCFVKPIKNTSMFQLGNEKQNFGMLKYSNAKLNSKGVNEGDLVVFTPNSEFEFIIEGERLYCMKSNDIALTHEHEGNEEENNPSWTKSSGGIN